MLKLHVPSVSVSLPQKWAQQSNLIQPKVNDLKKKSNSVQEDLQASKHLVSGSLEINQVLFSLDTLIKLHSYGGCNYSYNIQGQGYYLLLVGETHVSCTSVAHKSLSCISPITTE